MTKGSSLEKVWRYPYFSRLFHTSTALRSVELSKEWQGVREWIRVWQYPQFVRIFHISTPLRSVEQRMKKENRDLVASAGHWWWIGRFTGGVVNVLSFLESQFFTCGKLQKSSACHLQELIYQTKHLHILIWGTSEDVFSMDSQSVMKLSCPRQ